MTNGADQTATSGPDGPNGWMGLLDEATRREHRRHNIIHSSVLIGSIASVVTLTRLGFDYIAVVSTASSGFLPFGPRLYSL